MEEALNKVPKLVELFIEPTFFQTKGSRRYDRRDSSVLQLTNNAVGVVAAIGDTRVRMNKVNKCLCDCRFVLLTFSDDEPQRLACRVNKRVYLCGQAASRPSYLVFLGPPRPPEAS